MTEIIEVSGLQKTYGSHRVLQGIDFTVRQGETFALLGANGAGKTTTLECMEGLRRYDSGTITLHGRLGIQLQSSALPEYMQAREAVTLFAKWNRVPPDNDLLRELGIHDFAKQRYGTLSAGQKRRLHLALALTGDPDILVLDEPTAGLDVEGRAALHGLLRRLKSQGKTLVLASHDMAEVEQLCDRIGILHHGTLAFLGTPAELAAQVGQAYHITIRTNEGVESATATDILESLPALLAQCSTKSQTILQIQADRGSLEENFLKVARREIP